ncbi:MAG: hypothetical protein RL632_1588 [Bacteroidota bacterium]|jgi:hypothetical protein
MLNPMRILFALFTAILLGFSSTAQLKSPEAFLGFPLGTHFNDHHTVVAYFEQLETNSNGGLLLEEYGRTNENRPLVVAYISTPENLKRIEEIKKSHSTISSDEHIAIVWMSYNVHGNESSGTEAAMKTAHELITLHQDWLKNTLVILDPCINPDGRDRYVHWYNQVANSTPNADPSAAEHDEPWPSGRPNHYMFDLNRDWAWLTQVESQQRIRLYNQWLPHVHVDFHEQGINDPYYFAPAAEPYHKVITDWQREFQNGLGRNHATYFDKQGWFYFTREIFDLLYPSYGDTYPTFNGAVGMTYEQAGNGRAGLAIQTNDGDTLRLSDRIEHHHTTGISTVQYSSLKSKELIDSFKDFVTKKNYKYKSYIVGGNYDNVLALKKLLDAHDITYSFGTGQTTVKGFDYIKNGPGSMIPGMNHLIINTDQPKGTLVNVLFEPKTALSDSLTYDITAWSLPYAYGLEAIASETKVQGVKATPIFSPNKSDQDAYAYVTDWNSMRDARFLSELIQKGIRVRFAENPFTLNGKEYARGTLIIAKGDNSSKLFTETLISLANFHEKSLTATRTGMVDKGNDFGSSSVKMIQTPKVAMLFGDAMSSLSAGETWHFFENELNYPITQLNAYQIDAQGLAQFNVLIVPEGDASTFMDESTKSTLQTWISNGGKLIAIGASSAGFTADQGYALNIKNIDESKEGDAEEVHEHPHINYNEQEREYIKQTITGAIFRCAVDHTHPLAFGYTGDYFTLKLSADGYSCFDGASNVVTLPEKPELIAGFAGCEALKKQPKTLVIGQENMGNGCIIYMIDNPLFRGFWENGKLFMANAIFLSNQ